MSEICPGCDFGQPNKSDRNCGLENNCLANSCFSSFSVYGAVFIASNEAILNARLILNLGNDNPPGFQSQSPGSLYRPPIA